ncbi:MAG: hypothetical protein WAV21_02220 [Minisyncoccia bacterium]
MEEALREEVPMFVEHDMYGIFTSPVFWRKIFVHVYADEPKNDQDLRWGDLFKEGFPILRLILTEKGT